VIDSKGTQYDASTNILSTLLLTSDLKGTVEDPAYYFMDEDENTKEQLDLVMLTHGWTRYDVSKLSEKNFETSQSITGILKGGLLNKYKANEPVSLFSSEYGFFDRINTGDGGKFRFDNFEFPEGTEYLIQSKKSMEIVLDEEIFPAVNENIIATGEDDSLVFENRLTKEDNKYLSYSNIRTIDLETVTVTAKKPNKDRYHHFTSPFTKKIGSEEIERLHASDMYKLIEATVFVSLPRTSKLSNESRSSMLILVDNVEVRSEDLIDYSAGNVESIEYIKKTSTDINMFGLRASEGVILITTKRGNDEPARDESNVKIIIPLGYQVTKEFYSPVYKTGEQITGNIPDFRTTVYWNPNMNTQEDGKSDIRFYTSDSPESYALIIEGITEDGKIIYLQKDLK
jgi:hypothetical protein